MSYTVHTTQAFVLKSFPRAEADRIFQLYTKDFGRIDAQASGIRLLKSKLRYALQTHSCAIVSLVRGRREWKIVNALPLFSIAQTNRAKVLFINLLDRLIAGEIADPELFEFAESALQFQTTQVTLLYEFAALSVLWRLGYYDPSGEGVKELLMGVPSDEILEQFSERVENPGIIIRSVLSHTHL